MFRGVLLFACERAMGVELAITINVAIYAFFHIHKGLREAIGAIPLGVVLCLLTLKTGTIWISFFVHVVLSLSNEWFSLKYHPKIRVLR
jgi:membrane protease YdiL (CAAX protease family)